MTSSYGNEQHTFKECIQNTRAMYGKPSISSPPEYREPERAADVDCNNSVNLGRNHRRSAGLTESENSQTTLSPSGVNLTTRPEPFSVVATN